MNSCIAIDHAETSTLRHARRNQERGPLPERAERAIWEGQSARKREALSTDWGWASTLSLSEFLEWAGAARVREKSPGAEAMFTKIVGELGDDSGDVQVIDPDRGVGNTAAYVGPIEVPEAVVGKGVTSKVKIDPPPALAAEGEEGEGSPWAKAPVMAIDASALPSALLPKAVDGGVVESKRPEAKKEKRYGLLALAIGAVVVGLGVVAMMKAGEVPEKPAGGAAPMVRALPTATATATVEPDAGGAPSAGAVVPSAPSAPNMARPKGREDDPYDAAPRPAAAPVKTGVPNVPPPPPPTVTANVPPPTPSSQIFSPVPQY